MAKYLIDEYGELLGEFNDSDLLKVYNPLNTKRRAIGNKLFYKFYKDSILVFINGLISKQVSITLFKLIRLLNFGINEFVCINGLPANLKQLSIQFGMKDKTFYNHLRKLERLEIIKKVKNGKNKNVLINPYFIGYGTNCTDESLMIFSNSIWSKQSVYCKKNKRGRSDYND